MWNRANQNKLFVARWPRFNEKHYIVTMSLRRDFFGVGFDFSIFLRGTWGPRFGFFFAPLDADKRSSLSTGFWMRLELFGEVWLFLFSSDLNLQRLSCWMAAPPFFL